MRCCTFVPCNLSNLSNDEPRRRIYVKGVPIEVAICPNEADYVLGGCSFCFQHALERGIEDKGWHYAGRKGYEISDSTTVEEKNP